MEAQKPQVHVVEQARARLERSCERSLPRVSPCSWDEWDQDVPAPTPDSAKVRASSKIRVAHIESSAQEPIVDLASVASLYKGEVPQTFLASIGEQTPSPPGTPERQAVTIISRSPSESPCSPIERLIGLPEEPLKPSGEVCVRYPKFVRNESYCINAFLGCVWMLLVITFFTFWDDLFSQYTWAGILVKS